MTDMFSADHAGEPVEEPLGFTAADHAAAEDYPSLGPEYFASRRVVDNLFERLTESGLEQVVDKTVRDIQDKLWDAVRDHLLSDASQNVMGHMRQMVEGTVFAILQGRRWALERYPLSKYHDGQSVRLAIVEHCGTELIAKVARDEAAHHRYVADSFRRYRRVA